MPGYVTHYIFGRDIYDHLKDSLLKQNLYINRAVYSLGQQGPDIFFYYPCLCPSRTQPRTHGTCAEYEPVLCVPFREPQ